jgi:hypothetical protein
VTSTFLALLLGCTHVNLSLLENHLELFDGLSNREARSYYMGLIQHYELQVIYPGGVIPLPPKMDWYMCRTSQQV